MEDTSKNTDKPIEGAKQTSKYVNPQTGKKFSGAAIRKIKREAARQRGESQPRGHKRPRATQTTPPAEKRDYKRPRESTHTSPKTFSDAAAGIKMAIIDSRYPDKAISQEQATILREWLLRKVEEAISGDISPRFLECRLRGSVFFITCFDQATKDWLGSVLEGSTPLEGASLKLMEAKDLPQPVKCMVFIPGPETEPANIMKRISSQNKPLSTEGWQVISQKSDSRGQFLVVRMDKTSWDRMGEVTQHRPFLNFSRVEFRLLDKSKQPANRPVEMETESLPAGSSSLDREEKGTP